MLKFLTACLGALGALYLLIRIKFPWLYGDIKFLSIAIKTVIQIEKSKRKKELPIDLFERTADKFCHKPMIIHKGKPYSFTEVDKMANKVANVALGLGLKQGDTVAILIYNEPAFVWTWFGFEKIGVEVAFLNFNQRKKPLLHSIISSEAKAVFFNSGPELYAAIEDIAEDLENIDLYTFDSSGVEIPSRFRRLDLELKAAPEDRIPRSMRSNVTVMSTNCLIFTSGTTGLPKPVIVTHLKCLFAGFLLAYRTSTTSDDILYTCLPLYHSAGSMFGVGSIRRYGITMVLSERFSASRFFQECRQHNVTVIQYIGEMCRYLVNTPKSANDTDHLVTAAIGNGLRKDIWSEFQSRFKVDNIIEIYGATELSFGFGNLFNEVGATGRITPLLKMLLPIAFIKFDSDANEPVRNGKGRCVPVDTGEPGLLIIRFDKRMPTEGYKNKEEENKRRFLYNVFKDGDKYINSGDLLFIDKDYYVYFYDRLGDTFRWKGENVSTTEVANTISELPFVADSCVYGVTVPGCEGRAGMATIHLVDSDKVEPTEDMLCKIMEQCRTQLAGYAIPRFLRFTRFLDITSTFKQMKTTLKREGFDINLTMEPIYYFDIRHKKYSQIDKNIYSNIIDKHINF
ncbi:long-chain fatty acid transport protein 6-like [Mytilus trossulus]|uniref:long-chain fatty acid transport protein 6-like n=1 Tax=Mytilus trossulus TaxID=6551 RepID=UPI0030045F44